jgi:hypothetical protein
MDPSFPTRGWSWKIPNRCWYEPTGGSCLRLAVRRCMLPRGDRCNGCNGPDVPGAIVRTILRLLASASGAAFRTPIHTIHHRWFGLQHVVYASVAQLTEPLKSSIVLAACDWCRHVRVQSRELPKMTSSSPGIVTGCFSFSFRDC